MALARHIHPGDGNAVAGVMRVERGDDVAHGADGMAVEGSDRVTRLEPGLRRRAVGLDLRHRCGLAVTRLDSEQCPFADVDAGRGLSRLDLTSDIERGVDGNGEGVVRRAPSS